MDEMDFAQERALADTARMIDAARTRRPQTVGELMAPWCADGCGIDPSVAAVDCPEWLACFADAEKDRACSRSRYHG